MSHPSPTNLFYHVPCVFGDTHCFSSHMPPCHWPHGLSLSGGGVMSQPIISHDMCLQLYLGHCCLIQVQHLTKAICHPAIQPAMPTSPVPHAYNILSLPYVC